LQFDIEGAVYDRNSLREGKDFRGVRKVRFPQCLDDMRREDQEEFMQTFTMWWLQKQAEK